MNIRLLVTMFILQTLLTVEDLCKRKRERERERRRGGDTSVRYSRSEEHVSWELDLIKSCICQSKTLILSNQSSLATFDAELLV